MSIGSVRYQHHKGAETVELGLVSTDYGGFCIEDTLYVDSKQKKSSKRQANTLRGIHSAVIERVNTSRGGWCETLDGKGVVVYRHPTPQQTW